MTQSQDNKLAQAHEHAKQKARLSTDEQRALLSTLNHAAKPPRKVNWWQRSQWLIACCALITLVAVATLDYRHNSQVQFQSVAYERIDIYDLQDGEQRVRVARTAALSEGGMRIANLNLSESMRVRKQAYAHRDGQPQIRVAKLVNNQGDWLLADCREHVLIAISTALVDSMGTEVIAGMQSGALMALTFSADGELLTLRKSNSNEQCS